MIDNNIVVEAWNTVLFDKFVRFKHLLANRRAILTRKAG